MKKIIMVFISGVLYTSLITGNVNAQKASEISFADSKINHSVSSEESKIATEGTVVDPVDKSAIKAMEANLKAAKVNLKVTTHFNKNFRNVPGVTWSIEEKAIVAAFTMGEKSTRVVYNKKGNWAHTITNFQEDQLPSDIRSIVKEAYPGYNITLVQELSQGSTTLYIVHLEDPNSYKQILVNNNEITVYKEFEKSR